MMSDWKAVWIRSESVPELGLLPVPLAQRALLSLGDVRASPPLLPVLRRMDLLKITTADCHDRAQKSSPTEAKHLAVQEQFSAQCCTSYLSLSRIVRVSPSAFPFSSFGCFSPGLRTRAWNGDGSPCSHTRMQVRQKGFQGFKSLFRHV